MHSVTIACTITTLITTYIYIASFKVQLSQQLHCSVSYRWGYRNNVKVIIYRRNTSFNDSFVSIVVKVEGSCCYRDQMTELLWRLKDLIVIEIVGSYCHEN